jgi:hypothetical protein
MLSRTMHHPQRSRAPLFQEKQMRSSAGQGEQTKTTNSTPKKLKARPSPRGCSIMRRRRGAAAVEFAIVAPVFVVIVLGVAESSRLFEVQNQLALAARGGARLGAMDRTGLLEEGQTTNDKVADDVKHFLSANGLPGDQATVFIVDPEDSTTPFDMDDEVNELELFELRVELPYSAVSEGGGSLGESFVLSAKVVFRNARATLVQ